MQTGAMIVHKYLSSIKPRIPFLVGVVLVKLYVKKKNLNINKKQLFNFHPMYPFLLSNKVFTASHSWKIIYVLNGRLYIDKITHLKQIDTSKTFPNLLP